MHRPTLLAIAILGAITLPVWTNPSSLDLGICRPELGQRSLFDDNRGSVAVTNPTQRSVFDEDDTTPYDGAIRTSSRDPSIKGSVIAAHRARRDQSELECCVRHNPGRTKKIPNTFSDWCYSGYQKLCGRAGLHDETLKGILKCLFITGLAACCIYYVHNVFSSDPSTFGMGPDSGIPIQEQHETVSNQEKCTIDKTLSVEQMANSVNPLNLNRDVLENRCIGATRVLNKAWRRAAKIAHSDNCYSKSNPEVCKKAFFNVQRQHENGGRPLNEWYTSNTTLQGTDLPE